MQSVKILEEAFKNRLIEQEKTLSTPRMKYGILSKILFMTMDLFYGKKSTIVKTKVLELIARVPYQAWEK
jgi:ubiquinol oxidase